VAGVRGAVREVAEHGVHRSAADCAVRAREARRVGGDALVEHAFGCAHSHAKVQSGVVREIGTTSARVPGPSHAASCAHRGEAAAVLLGDLGQVVARQPHARGDRRVEGDDHDAAARHATQLPNAALAPSSRGGW